MTLWVFLIERLQMCKKDRNGKDGAAVNTESHGWASKNQSFHFRIGKSRGLVGWSRAYASPSVVCQESEELSVP